MLCLIGANTSWNYQSCIGQFGSRFIYASSIPVFYTYLIYLIFIICVVINNDLRHPLKCKSKRRENEWKADMTEAIILVEKLSSC